MSLSVFTGLVHSSGSFAFSFHATVFIISDILVLPKELENYITVFDIPLPTLPEITTIINTFVSDVEIEIDQNVLNDIALSFKGLNEFQIKQILNLAYQDGGYIDSDDKHLILKEKEQFVNFCCVICFLYRHIMQPDPYGSQM